VDRVVLVRYGELGLKGKNRPFFEQKLMDHMRRATAELGRPWIRKTYGRFFVTFREGQADPGRLDQVIGRLQRVFGIVGLSPAVRVPLDLDAIYRAAERVVTEHLAVLGRRDGEVPFKVRGHRANKQFPHTSMDLNRLVGAYLLRQVPGLKVDVHRPEIEVAVEVREDAAYCYSRDLPGPGGLPVGSSGRALLLLSGGIDSPVAGWMGLKRGLDLDAVHFHSFPFTSERSLEKVEDLCRVLATWSGGVTLHVVHFTEVQRAIQQAGPPELGITLMRRMMVRIAERIARREKLLALVTGESLGQVASQTLESIGVIEAVTALPVLRPLIGLDKAEIVRLAERIGTLDISNRPYEDCCALFVPRHPSTRPRSQAVEAAEAALDVEALVQGAVERTETLRPEPGPPA